MLLVNAVSRDDDVDASWQLLIKDKDPENAFKIIGCFQQRIVAYPPSSLNSQNMLK